MRRLKNSFKLLNFGFQSLRPTNNSTKESSRSGDTIVCSTAFIMIQFLTLLKGGDNIPFPGKNPNLGLFTLVQQAGQQIDGSQEQPLSPGYYSTTHDSFSEHQQHGEESIVDDLSREHFHPSYEIYTSSRLQQGSYDDNQHVMVYQPGDNQQEAIYSGQEHAVKQPVFYNEHHAPPPPSHPPPSKATATRLWVESMLTSIPHFQHYSPMWGYNPSTGEPWLSLRTLYPSSYNKLIGKGGRHDVIAAFLNKIYMRTNVKFRIEYLWVNRQSLILLWIEFTHLHTCVDMRAWEVLGELRAFLQEWIKIPDPGRVDFAYDMFMNRASGNRASLALPAGFPSGPNATIAAWADVDTKSTCQNESEPWLSQQQKHQIQQFPYGSSDQTNFPNHYIARQSQNYAAPATGAGGPVGQAPSHGPHKSSRRASRGILGPRYESGNRISKQRHTDAQFMHGAQTGPQGFVGSIVSNAQ